MSSTLVIPPPDIRTRIVGMKSRHVLYSHKRDPNCLNHVDMTVPYDDQYWYIQPGKGEHASHYLIVSDQTKRALFVNPDNNEAWRVGTFEPIGQYPDHYFDLKEQEGQGIKAGQFRIHAPSSGGVIFSRKDNKPEVGSIRITEPVYDDQWFTFELEPLDCVSVDFDVKNAIIKSTQPKSIFSQTSNNGTDVEQKPVITISKTTEQQSTFETEVGLEVGVSTSFKCGVPILAEGKVEVSVNVHSNLKWGTTNTTTQSWEASVPLTVPPKSKFRVTASVTESILHVPFTTTWKSPKSKKTMTTKGIFKGVSSSDLTTNFFPVEK